MSKIGENEMSKQETDFSRRKMLGQTVCFMLRRSVLAGIIAVLIGASLVFTGSASAHNINLARAKEMALAWANEVVANSPRNYVQGISTCVRAFPGHNHYVRCKIQYEDKVSKNADGVFACTETIEVYFQSHRDGENYNPYMKHTSRSCGTRLLRGPNP